MLYLKIWWHKRQAIKLRREIYNLRDSYSCGLDMLNIITGGEYNRLVNSFNKYKCWLEDNDPKYPK